MSASEERLYFLLQSVAQRMKKYADAEMQSAAGITTAQSAVLALIISEGGCNLSFLANKLRLQKSAITTMSERLERDGLVTKQRSEDDRRVWHLTATKKGKTAYFKLERPIARINALMDAELPKTRIHALAEDLRVLLRKFET